MAWLAKNIMLVAVAVGGAELIRATDVDRTAFASFTRLVVSAASGTPESAIPSTASSRALAIGAVDEVAVPAPHSLAPLRMAQAPTTEQPVATDASATARDHGAGGLAPAAASDSGTAAQRLASAIQTELKRVGCYQGSIDGDWGSASRRAMRQFTNRVSASLSVDQPDYILLTLLQGHKAQACGTVCALGEEVNDKGACQPREEIAEARRKVKLTEPAAWARALAGAAGAGAAETKVASAGLSPSTGSVAEKGGKQALSATAPAAPNVQAAVAAISEERAHIAVAEERRRQQAVVDAKRRDMERRAADAQAIAEANNLAIKKAATEADAERQRRIAVAEQQRITAAENARMTAAARRLAELAAVADRTAADKRAQMLRDPERSSLKGPASTMSPSIEPVTPPVTTAAVKTGTITPPPPRERWTVERREVRDDNRATRQVQRSADKPRYVGRYIPPPTYRVGRLPQVVAPAPRAAASRKPSDSGPVAAARRLDFSWRRSADRPDLTQGNALTSSRALMRTFDASACRGNAG